MENAQLVGLSRQVALQREIDVIANNIANLNTTGFKNDNSIFEEFLMPVDRANNIQRPSVRRQLQSPNDSRQMERPFVHILQPPDISKAQKHLGWRPRIALREGLDRTIEYFDRLLTSRVRRPAAGQARAQQRAEAVRA